MFCFHDKCLKHFTPKPTEITQNFVKPVKSCFNEDFLDQAVVLA